MDAEFPPGQQQRNAEEFGVKHRTGLVTLLFTDMVGSTTLKQERGDRMAAELFRTHHELIRETLLEFKGAEEIETAGDSFLTVFATPSDAVRFALLVQFQLRNLGEQSETRALDRIGIHLGEVVFGNEAESGRAKGLFGIPIDICSRRETLIRVAAWNENGAAK